jgi:hypothetical protein
MKKIILLALTALMMVVCDMAMDSLDVLNGAKYVVNAKKESKDKYVYSYRLVKVGDTWYDYHYKDTANFNIGDTIVIIVRRISN